MEVVYFILQTHGQYEINSFLRQIDPQAPCAEPLEGGDGNGPLYLCMIDAQLQKIVEEVCGKIDHTHVYAKADAFRKINVDPKRYSPEYHVQWNLGADPSLE